MRLAAALAIVVSALVVASGSPAAAGDCDRPLVVTLRHRDGTPVAGGSVTVFGPDAAKGAPFAFRSAATSDARGEATFCVPREGTYAAYALAARHRSGGAEVAVGPAGTTLVLVLKETTVGTLSVHVRGEGDAPLADANVRVEELDAGDREARPPSYDAISDVTGRVRFHVEGASGWKVTVRHPRHEPDELEVAGPGEWVDLTLAMHLQPKATATPRPTAEARRAARPLEGRTPRPDATDPSPDEPPPIDLPPIELPPIELPPIEFPPPDDARTASPTPERPTAVPPSPERPKLGPSAAPPPKVAPPKVAPPTSESPTPAPTPVSPATPPPGSTTPTTTPPATPPAEAPADYAGTWRPPGGTTLTLAQVGPNVTGAWSHLDSTLTGVVRGRVLEFTTTSPRGLTTSGRVTLDATGRAFFGDGTVTGAGGGAKFLFDAERVR